MSNDESGDVEIRGGYWGATLVVMDKDDADMEHHWWFDHTDDGKWVLSAEIVHYDDEERHYVDADEMYVPHPVKAAIEAKCGVDEIHRITDYR